jgi:polyisoprenyl-teichoic acid--peptidoglycan teichoic acid transferase
VSTFNPSKFTASPKPSKKWLWLTLGLGAVAVVSAGAGALLAVTISSTPLMQTRLSWEEAKVFNHNQPLATGKNLHLPQLTRPVNIMVLGMKVLTSDVDTPQAEIEKDGYEALVNTLDGLSDTMLMVRFDPQQQRLVVLSLPRDTRTWVEGQGLTKLNEANYYGGPALAAKATSELLSNIAIDRYIRINVQGVEKLIDALGGVKIFVPQEMKYVDESQHLYINLKQGEQRLNGAQALQFLRFRHDDLGDIGRVQRQQMMMRSLMEQALNPATLARIPQILSVIQANIDTNLTVEELIALAGFAAQGGTGADGQVARPQTQMLMVPGDFSRGEEYEASYWLPDQGKLDAIVAEYFGAEPRTAASGYAAPYQNPERETAETMRVAIQDSTGKLDAAGLLERLSEAGYGGGFVDRPWGEPLAVTEIIAQQGDDATAKAIQQILGFGEVRVESTGNLESSITIRVGKDARIAKLLDLRSPQNPVSPLPTVPKQVKEVE